MSSDRPLAMKSSTEIWNMDVSSDDSELDQPEEFEEEKFDPFCKESMENSYLF